MMASVECTEAGGGTDGGAGGGREYLWYKVLKHSCLLGIWLSMGLVLEVFGPTIPDLKAKIGLDYEEISRALVGTSVGYFAGSAVGGVIHERFYRLTDLLMSLSVFIGAVAMFVVPWITSLTGLGLVFCCIGVSVALSNAGGNAMVLHLWGEASGPPMYLLHFCFGVGGLLTPLIARPFLSTSPSEDGIPLTDNVTQSNFTPPPYLSTNNASNTTESSNLFYPFTIIGGINLIFSLQMFLLYICGYPKGFPRRTGSKNLRTLCSPRSCMTGTRGGFYGTLLLALLFFYFFHAVGGENVYGKWVFSYALETEVAFTKDQAALLTSVFWLSHMTGRGLGIILSKFLPIRVIIIGDILSLLVASTVLTIAGHDNALVLWVFTACMGLLVSPLFPAGLLWANRYLQMNSMTVMVCILGSSTGHLCYVYASGYMFEYLGARSMMIIEIFYSVAILVTFVLLEVVGRLSLKRGTQKVEASTKGGKFDASEEIMMQNAGN